MSNEGAVLVSVPCGMPMLTSVPMAHTDPGRPRADRALIAAHAEVLRELARRFGITELRFASPGRLVGHVANDRDALDVAAFELGAAELLQAEVSLYSDAVLGKPNASPDLVMALPL